MNQLDERNRIIKDKHASMLKSLRLLTTLHQPQSNVEVELTDSMFLAKNNVKAFENVTYYILNILEGDAVKKIIKYWPICDKNGSSFYRKELLAHLNKIPQFKDLRMYILMNTQKLQFILFFFKLTLYVMEVVTEKMDIDKNLPVPISNGIIDIASLKSINEIESKKIAKMQKKYKSLSDADEKITKSLQRLKYEYINLQASLVHVRDSRSVEDEDDYLQVEAGVNGLDDIVFELNNMLTLKERKPHVIDLEQFQRNVSNMNFDYLSKFKDDGASKLGSIIGLKEELVRMNAVAFKLREGINEFGIQVAMML